MNRNSFLIQFLFINLISTLLFLSSCNEDGPEEELDFDRKAMLSSLAEGLIIPNFEALQESVQNLEAAAASFISNPGQEQLLVLREAWKIAVTDYQYCSAFGFGPANLPLGSFSTVLGVFPVDENQVELNLKDPSFNLAATFDRDVRGFYAVEYLIYGNEKTDDELLASFDQDRVAYLNLLIEELRTTIDQILIEWESDYKGEFIANDGTSAGSSVSLLYNEFIKDYENLKNFKVELPAGLTAGQSAPAPELVEAYYSGISRELIIAHFNSSRNIWLGRSPVGQELIGFEEYLMEVVGGPELINQTKEALAQIDDAINDLPTGQLAVNVDAPEVEALRDLLQANTANFKSSMSSLLGISITFNSGDGD